MNTVQKIELASAVAGLIGLGFVLYDRTRSAAAAAAAAPAQEAAAQQVVAAPITTGDGVSALSLDSSTGLEGYVIPQATAQNAPALPTISGISIPDFSSADVTAAPPSPVPIGVGPVVVPAIYPTVAGTPALDVSGMAAAMAAMTGNNVLHINVGS